MSEFTRQFRFSEHINDLPFVKNAGMMDVRISCVISPAATISWYMDASSDKGLDDLPAEWTWELFNVVRGTTDFEQALTRFREAQPKQAA